MDAGINATEAPDFTLTDPSGRAIRLADYRGVKNILLVFNRGFA